MSGKHHSRRSGGISRRWQGSPDSEGRRPSVYVNCRNPREFQQIAGHLKALEHSKRYNLAIPRTTAAWLHGLSDDVYAKLVRAGLAEPREQREAADVLLADHIRKYIESRSDLAPRSQHNLRQTELRLKEFFGPEKRLRHVTAGEAKDFRRWLCQQGYAEATVAMFIKKAKQFFNDAVDREIIRKSPFQKVKAGSQVNPLRMEYVPVEKVEAVMSICDLTWKLRLALARFAGLRSPSEPRRIEWADVHWDKDKILIRSKKTEKQGKPLRWVPISDKLRPILLEAFQAAEEGSKRIFPSLTPEANLRTQLHRLCERADVTPWQKDFQNLRLSCETDWIDEHGLATACKWSGNTPEVAAKHYHIVREEQFAKAAKRGAEFGAEVKEKKGNGAEPEKKNRAASEAFSSACGSIPTGTAWHLTEPIPPRGVEPLSSG
jgi:integrase